MTTPRKVERTSSSRLVFVDDMRGIALLCILVLHGGNALMQRGLEAPGPEARIVWAAVLILFHGSTLYFALISGLIYAAKFRMQPHGPFLKGRFAAVGAPYASMTIGLTLLLAGMDWRRSGTAAWLDLPGALATNLLLGEAWNTFWYIPVILILYALSPLLWKIATDKRPIARVGLAGMLLAPLLVSRTGTEVTLAMIVYMNGAYVLGMLVGANPEAGLAASRRWWPASAAVAAGATAFLVWLFATGTDHLGPVSLRESGYYVQRLSLAMLLLAALPLLPTSGFSPARRLLHWIAAASFGLYFLHGPLMRPAAALAARLVPQDQPWHAVLLAVAATTLVGFLVSAAILLVAKRLLGTRSRMLTGY